MNGNLEGSRSSNPYKGMAGSILIGAVSNGTTSYFSGYIDQVFLVTQAKSAAERVRRDRGRQGHAAAQEFLGQDQEGV